MPPCSSQACSPASTARPVRVGVRVVVVPERAEERAHLAARAAGRSGRRASPPAPPRACPRVPSACARETLAAIANSSFAMSTSRNRKACFRSAAARKTTIEWKISARELAARALDEAQVASRACRTRRSAGANSPRSPEPEVPGRRRTRRPSGACASFFPSRHLGVDERAGDLEVLVDRLARHEEVHDLRGALEDEVDAQVAHRALDADRRLAARRERALLLVAAAAADLHRLVDEPPGLDGVPLLRRRRLEPDVVALLVGERLGEVGDRLHREDGRGHLGELVRDRLVLADLLAPLDARGGPLAAELEERACRRPPPPPGARAGRC